MKEIKLLRLTLENFKACASRTFEFNGRDAAVYGANGTGKTTVYNALTWLLFDKIAGSDGTVMTAPDIKPNGADGEVADHAAISSVEAAFDVDGAESVSELLPIDTQIIRLVVSRDDKELRCELW